MVTRSTVVTAALAAAAALAATGITYASAASTEPAQAAPVVQQQAAAPVSAPNGGNGGNGNEGNGNEGKGNEGRGNEGRGGGYENKGGGENRGHREHFRGRIQINERTYTAEGGGCITVVSGLGSKTLNIRNESRRTVEVFRGATCDNGAPLATVGPWSSSDGVHPGRVKGGVKVHNGVVGSFRVIERFHGGGKGGGDFGEGGDFGGDY
ncbi:hypothetical protein [Streptomyces sp. Ncost-T10-10d]|uniref:hypothetical protein n=1 Tax=Streptomyces sp. Ncost-T10-10d TaxID=1839774 RepID=UPI00081F7325|nr:hypothetical protein [Streptomyces sp. Ncost-T10-10d]SCF56389.1 hypothetical protein GA0115254_100226 [Streptomyces sp. Ncost-T10-10d]